MAHRLKAEDFDIAPLAAELILQALRPVVNAHHGIEVSGASVGAIDVNEHRSKLHAVTRRG